MIRSTEKSPQYQTTRSVARASRWWASRPSGRLLLLTRPTHHTARLATRTARRSTRPPPLLRSSLRRNRRQTPPPRSRRSYTQLPWTFLDPTSISNVIHTHGNMHPQPGVVFSAWYCGTSAPAARKSPEPGVQPAPSRDSVLVETTATSSTVSSGPSYPPPLPPLESYPNIPDQPFASPRSSEMESGPSSALPLVSPRDKVQGPVRTTCRTALPLHSHPYPNLRRRRPLSSLHLMQPSRWLRRRRLGPTQTTHPTRAVLRLSAASTSARTRRLLRTSHPLCARACLQSRLQSRLQSSDDSFETLASTSPCLAHLPRLHAQCESRQAVILCTQADHSRRVN